MMIVRHAELKDLQDIYLLAEKSGVGFTSLPANIDILSKRIIRTQKTLAGEVPESEQGYLFVLEDFMSQRVVGLSAIEVSVGLTSPFYSYRMGKQVHASDELNVYKTLDTLFLTNDLTGVSELCSLIIDPTFRVNSNGKFLSKIRFLFIAAFRHLFKQKLIAEMRGYSTEDGISPFWNALGHHFFKMDFATADYLSGIGQKSFIAELMPRFPIYIDLLPESAKNVIGQVHQQTLPAFKLLQLEGLEYCGYVDIFDGGPTLQADIKNLKAIQNCQQVQIKIEAQNNQKGNQAFMVANDHYENYKALLVSHDGNERFLKLTPEQAQILNVKLGDQVRILALHTQEKS
ncbi:arginine N-succinyltransferase [Acinetobacter sp. ANC 4558]|uniref:arginine N-succinyltransferase n=1 Tax=Acinetobacter sp. ANC 4558 TaxID=1977876 RepID=UPI000A32C224|nr:arginine N-succinyltransferase [Acinetobacter sp. ANC 4558]OTG88057.1 arginine N-succinyltransferase [Acinetobacter sp. ANC 4558]